MLPRTVLAAVLCLFVHILSAGAQDSLLYSRITLPDTLVTTEKALQHIERHTGLSFSYNSGLIDKRRKVNLYAGNERLIDLLTRLFNDNTLQYAVIGKHLVIYRTLKTLAVNPGQKGDSVYYFEIRGKVFDSETRQPLPFSSIFLVGRTIGTISNEDGEFLLKLSSSEMGQVLRISCIGYKYFQAPVSDLVNSQANYYLDADIISIQEVIIRKLNPIFLIQTANSNKEKNYPQQPALLTLFYRESIQRGTRFTLVSEAILENFKTSYASLAQDQFKILKGRKSELVNANDTVMLRLKAGLNTMLMLDVVKNPPDFMSTDYLDEYVYRMTDIVVEDGRDNYAIEFVPRPGASPSAIYSGRIIIDINDMAFRWIEFHVSPEYLGQATNLYILRKPSNLTVKMLKANYKVAFRQTGNKYYLHMIQCETGFRIRKRKQFSGTVYNTKLEMAVTGIDTLDVSRFPAREVARPYEFFTEQLGAYDETFWGEYNFITPDESIEHAIERINKIQAERKEE